MSQVNLVFQTINVSVETSPIGSVATQLDSVTFDATPTEQHDADTETTDSPVEQGVDVTDHARPKPRTLTLEAIVSEAPIPPPGSAPGTAPDPQAPGTAYQTLLHMRDNATLLSVETSLESYDSMLLTHIGVARKAADGKSLRVQLGFKEIQVVSSQTVAIARTLPKTIPTAKVGKVEPDTNTSWSKSFTNAAGWTTPGSGTTVAAP